MDQKQQTFHGLFFFYDTYIAKFGEKLIRYIKHLLSTIELHFLVSDRREARQGDVYMVNFSVNVKSEYSFHRPGVVVSRDIFNAGGNVVVAPITSFADTKVFLGDVIVEAGIGGLTNKSVVKTSNLRDISKARLMKKIGEMPKDKMDEIRKSLYGIF